MMPVRLGALGWGTHVPRGGNPNRESKIRAAIVVMENKGQFAVIFGRSEPYPGTRYELVSDQSAVGKVLDLREPTYFGGDIQLLPADFDVKGYFVTQLSPEGAKDPAFVEEHDLWLRIRALAYPPAR
jgi:hypothetical protein